MRRFTVAALAAVPALFSLPAEAQDAHSSFANQGYTTISAERLFGLTFTNDTADDPSTPGAEDKLKLTLIGFGTNVAVLQPFAAPQLGVDHFVIDGLSLGVAFTLWTLSGEQESTAPGQPTDTNNLNDVTVLRLTPRVGYGIMFTDVLGLWARGGLTYYTLKSDSDTRESWEHGWAATLDALLMISPLDHFAIHIGPTFDIGFAGEDETNPADPAQPTVTNDVTRRQYGLQGGISGWF